jgi:hypothetical protein
MVLKTVNCFPKLNSSSLHARLIFDYQNPAMVGRPNSGGTGIRQHPATKILLEPESGDIQQPSPADKIPTRFGWIQPNFAKMAGILPDLEESDRNPTILTGSG